ncbi:MAG: hypothetical protein CSA38_04960 [Flavobacteriales bacterium]|nr:MAG: hypothetical protein CSA38_04960 [Flavobacteriales bacterium]
MKKIINIIGVLIFLFSHFIYSQSIRVYYELDYQPSKASKDRKKTIDLLTIKGNQSTFQNQNVLMRDSLFIKAFSEHRDLMQKEQKSIYKKIPNAYKVIKKDNEKLILNEYIGNLGGFYYEEKMNLNWAILNETQKIENILCQKATTQYGGRQWTAWFSNEIPINNGPYKFGNLPGLIIKMNDDKNEFIWTMKGLRHDDKFQLYIKNMMEHQGFACTKISKKQFQKTIKKYYKNPLGNYMETFQHYKKDADFIKKLREYEKAELDFIKNHNNSIEKY